MIPSAPATGPIPPPRRRLRVAAWIAVGALAVVGIVAALGGTLGEPLARRALSRASERLAGTVTPGRMTLEGWTTVVLDRVEWHDGDDLNLAARDVRVRLDPWSALFGGSPIREVAVGSLAFRLGDPQAPFASPGALLARLKAALDPPGRERAANADDAGATAPRGPARPRRARPMPLLRLDALSGQVHCRPFGSALVEGGWLHVTLPEEAIAGDARQVDGGLDLTVDGDAPRHLALRGRMLPGMQPDAVTATSTPPIAFGLAGGQATLSGAAWSRDAVSLLEPAWNRPDALRVDARAVAVRWDPDGGTADLRWLPEGVPEAVGRILARHPLREIEVDRPVVVMPPRRDAPVPSRPEGEEDGVETVDATPATPSTPGAPPPPDFRTRITAIYGDLERRVADALAALGAHADRMPPIRLSVRGGTLRVAGAGGDDAADESLANISLALWREPGSGGTIRALARFETPETRPGDDEVQADFDPATRTLNARLKATALPLHPVRDLLPRAFDPAGDGVLGPADLRMTATIPDAIRIDGTLAVRGLTLDLPAVASTPIRDVDARATGTLSWNLRDGAMELADAVVGIGRIEIPLTASAVGLRESPRLRVDATMTRMGAQDALASIPPDLVPALEGVRLSGTIAASATLDIDTRNLSAMRFEVLPDIADMTTVSLGKAAGVELLKTHFLHRIERGDKSVVARVVGEPSPEWVPLETVPPYLIAALTTSEDAEFFRHQGFSPEGIRRSLRVNLERGGFYQGASTLSQQLVKNLFLSREKTLARKLQEAFLTWQVEQYLTKEKILELYLNVIEWGPGVWGVGGAARHYFAREPADLTLLEAAYLVSVIPAPSRYHAHWDDGVVPRTFEQRVKRLVAEMARRGLVDAAEADAAQEQSLRLASPNRPDAARDGETSDEIPDDEFSD